MLLRSVKGSPRPEAVRPERAEEQAVEPPRRHLRHAAAPCRAMPAAARRAVAGAVAVTGHLHAVGMHAHHLTTAHASHHAHARHSHARHARRLPHGDHLLLLVLLHLLVLQHLLLHLRQRRRRLRWLRWLNRRRRRREARRGAVGGRLRLLGD